MKFELSEEDLHEDCRFPLCGAVMKRAIYVGNDIAGYKLSVAWGKEGEMPMFNADGSLNFITKE